MAVSAAAKSNHERLFGDRVSTLAQTDPELIEYFDNFAFDEVAADAARLDDTLDLHTRLMVQLAAVLSPGGLAALRVMADASTTSAIIGPRTMERLESQLPSAQVTLSTEILDRSDELVATGRDPRRVTATIGAHDDLLVVKLDVTSPDDAKAAAEAAVDRFGRVDVVVNNAGNFIAGFRRDQPRRFPGAGRDELVRSAERHPSCTACHA